MELWNTTDVARFLGVKPGTVSAYRHRGQMPAPCETVGARTHLWDAEVIRRWKAHREGTARSSSPERSTPDEWLVHGERELYRAQGDWVRLSLVDVEPPADPRFEHHVVTLRPASMVALLTPEHDRVGLVWRHRFAPGIWNWELPGGLVDKDESPSRAARREVLEETGFKVRGMRHLVTFEPVVGMVRSPHHVFAGIAGSEVAGGRTEHNEGGRLEWVSLESVDQRIKDGEVRNSGTLVALLYLLAFGFNQSS